MSEAKVIQVLQRVLEKTRAGELDWEATADEDTFIVSFPDYSVEIWSGVASPGGIRVTTYRFGVVDSKGRTLEFIRAKPGEDHYDLLEELFDLARRRALKVDETLDHILGSLEQSVETGVRDDLPWGV